MTEIRDSPLILC